MEVSVELQSQRPVVRRRIPKQIFPLLIAAGISLGSEEFVLTSDGNDWLEVEAIKFETIIMNKEKNESRRSDPQNLYQLSVELLSKQARFGAAGAAALRRSGKAKYRGVVGKHRMAKEGWSIVATESLAVERLTTTEEEKPLNYTEAVQVLTQLKLQNPAKAAGLKIMRLSEVAGN